MTMVLQEGGLPFVLEGRAALDDGLAVREEVDLVHQGDELLHVERTAAIHIVGEEDVGQPLRCGTGAVAQLQELAEPNGASAVRIEREEELLHLALALLRLLEGSCL